MPEKMFVVYGRMVISPPQETTIVRHPHYSICSPWQWQQSIEKRVLRGPFSLHLSTMRSQSFLRYTIANRGGVDFYERMQSLKNNLNAFIQPNK